MRSILVKLSALFTILVMVTLVATSCFLYSNDDSTLDLEDEILVVNTNGKLVRKSEISRNLKHMTLFDNGNTIGLIFRDKIEFIKI